MILSTPKKVVAFAKQFTPAWLSPARLFTPSTNPVLTELPRCPSIAQEVITRGLAQPVRPRTLGPNGSYHHSRIVRMANARRAYNSWHKKRLAYEAQQAKAGPLLTQTTHSQSTPLLNNLREELDAADPEDNIFLAQLASLHSQRNNFAQFEEAEARVQAFEEGRARFNRGISTRRGVTDRTETREERLRRLDAEAAERLERREQRRAAKEQVNRARDARDREIRREEPALVHEAGGVTVEQRMTRGKMVERERREHESRATRQERERVETEKAAQRQRVAQEQEAARRRAEEEEHHRRLAEFAEQQRRAAEEEARQRALEEELRQRASEEQARLQPRHVEPQSQMPPHPHSNLFELYDVRWKALRSTDPYSDIAFQFFPWPVLFDPVTDPSQITFDAVQQFLAQRGCGTKTPRENLKAEILKWHPDKLTKQLPKVREEDRERVREGGELVAKFLNTLMERV
ncbi:hypothetical protein H0H81_008654 [Sphagnurus paluster]|uniref:Uncharacterized protein n=1 Tax=Sphagnurus paluster TaxID=117069 RepID=A0A9P7K321_9AGAR|nr:hypothetical protein H0H81_008654 [Sphagnurus paluster]